jgi:hypothetical protein
MGQQIGACGHGAQAQPGLASPYKKHAASSTQRQIMRAVLTALVLATSFTPALLSAQNAPRTPERGLNLTIFRSPATGVELRSGHVSVHAGFYPTIISNDGVRDNVNFIRIGGSYYAKSSGSTPYITPSVMISLDRDWKHGALTEVGYRAALYRTLHGRLGAAVLTTIDGEVRVNPTIGMDVRLGGTR